LLFFASRYPKEDAMAELDIFSTRIENLFAAARDESRCRLSQPDQLMAEFTARRGRFNVIAPRLVESTIRPRIKALALFFPNANAAGADCGDRCICLFGYCNGSGNVESDEASRTHAVEVAALQLDNRSIIPQFDR
jgi:hypothetical protein